ncbi:MAG: RICIN domain-containing protein [Bacteroidota bacterium]
MSPICLSALLISLSLSAQDKSYVYEKGTCWEFTNIIKRSDPSTFESIRYRGEENALMWDREANDHQGAWLEPLCWVYDLRYEDNIKAEMRLRKNDFSQDESQILAQKYGQIMGQLPACLREGVELINIMRGDAVYGGNDHLKSIDITIGEISQTYERTGNEEEVIFHEATHAALDHLYKEGWTESRDKDPIYISKYAAENPNREDISESFLTYFIYTYKNHRVSSAQASKIAESIPHRIAFYKNLQLNMYPIIRSEQGKPTPESKASIFDPNKYYRLTCQFQGEGKSLDVVNDNQGNRLHLYDTGPYSSQYWKISPLSNGYYRLSCKYQGEDKSLSVMDDEQSNQLQLSPSGDDIGQQWKIEPLAGGYYRLSTRFPGEGKSLDVVNDGQNDQLQLAPSGNYTGQYWKLTEVK